MTNHDSLLTAYLWVIAALAVAWRAFPAVCHLLKLTRFRLAATAGVWEPLFLSQDKYLRVFKELEDLGFQPLGLIEARYYFTGTFEPQRWPILCSDKLNAYASVYQHVPHVPVRTSFATLLQEGTTICTGNDCIVFPSKLGNAHYRVVGTEDIAELLAAHQRHVEEFVTIGTKVAEHNSLAAVLQLTTEHVGAWIRYSEPWSMQALFHLYLFAGLLPLAIGLSAGWNQPFAPFVAVLGAIAHCLYQQRQWAKWLEAYRNSIASRATLPGRKKQLHSGSPEQTAITKNPYRDDDPAR